jgi:apolipoprotein N-acyltransferase
MRLFKKMFHKNGGLKVVGLMAAFVALLTLPFVESGLGWAGFFCFIPLFYALEIMKKLYWSMAKQVLFIWLSGWGFLLIVMSFILQINTSSWTFISSPYLSGLIIFSWLACTLVMSLGFVLFGWVILRFRAYENVLKLLLIVPAAWVVGEFARSWITSLTFTGPEGTLGNFFNFGHLGFAATGTPLGYASRVAGLYGVSFLIIMVNVILYLLIKKAWKPAFSAAISVLSVVLLGYFGFRTIDTTGIRVAAVQVGAIDQRFYESQVLHFLDTNPSLWSRPAKIIALPEYANFFEQGSPSFRKEVINKLTHNQPALFVYSRQKSGQDGHRKNEIVYMKSDGTELSAQEKNFLIPGGEYLPYSHRLALRLVGKDQIIQVFNGRTGISKGRLPEHPVSYDSVSYGALACSGAIAPQLYRNLAHQGAEVLINNASLNVFKNSPLYREQSESMVRFSAVATAKPFIQAARGNYAYIFDQNGHSLSESKELGVGLLEAEIKPSPHKTLYTKFGEYMMIVSVLVLVGFAVSERKHTNKPSKAFK